LDNDVLKNIIEADPRETAEELAEIFGTSATTVLRHLHEIGKVSRGYPMNCLTKTKLRGVQFVLLCCPDKNRNHFFVEL
jgi:hypothetical protein